MFTNEEIPLTKTLTTLLSNTIAYYVKAHAAHWNVIGPDFGEYHALFEHIYSETYEAIDPLAEILRKLGVSTPNSLENFNASKTLTTENVQSDAVSLADDLLNATQIILKSYKEAFDQATSDNEQGIANFLAEQIDHYEMWRWQLSASLGKQTVQDVIAQSMIVDAFLEHHGVKGQKWGLRNNKTVSIVPASEDHNTAHSLKRKPLHSLNNQELKKVNERLNLEKNYKNLNPPITAVGKKHASKILKEIGITGAGVAAVKVYNSSTGKAVAAIGKQHASKILTGARMAFTGGQ